MSEEHEDLGPEAASRLETAAAVEYGERYEACQVTASKVLAAKRLIGLAGDYKSALVLADAVWFADCDEAGAVACDTSADEEESECQPDCEAWLARARKVIAAEKLLRLASGYAEALMLLDAAEIVLNGEKGYQQVLKVRNAAADYHARVAAALKRRDEGK